MKTTNHKAISILLITALALTLLAGCASGGGETPATPSATATQKTTTTPETTTSQNAASTPITTTTQGSPAMQETASPPQAAFTTYEIGGYYAIDIPSELEVEDLARGWMKVSSVRNGYLVWELTLRYDTGEYGGFETWKRYHSERREQAKFTLFSISGQEGFYSYFESFEDHPDNLYIFFPFGNNTGNDQPYGSIVINDPDKKGAERYLDDPVIQAILASVRLLEQAPEVSEGPPKPVLPDSLRDWTSFIGEINMQMVAASFPGVLPSEGRNYKDGVYDWVHIEYKEYGKFSKTDFDLTVCLSEDGLVLSAENQSGGDPEVYGVFLLLAISSDITLEQARAAVEEAVIYDPNYRENRKTNFAEVGSFTFYFNQYFHMVGVYVNDAEQNTRRIHRPV